MTTSGQTRTGLPPATRPPASPPRSAASDAPGAPDPPRAPRSLGWGLALIGAGVLWILALTGVSVPWEIVLPVLVIGVGVVLLVAGRAVSRSGMIGLGIALSVLALAVSVTPTAVPVSAGDRTHSVTDIADLESNYQLGAGSLVLDLRDLELPDGTTELTAGVGMGELVVRVPAGAVVRGEGRVAMGEVVAFDGSRGGIAPTLTFAESADGSDRILVLDLRVGLGSIEVDR